MSHNRSSHKTAFVECIRTGDLQGVQNFVRLWTGNLDKSNPRLKELLKEKLNDHKETALHIAVKHEQENIVKWLLQYEADICSRDLYLRTVLHTACDENKSTDIISLILKNEGVDVNAKDENGITPVWLAAEKGNSSVVKLLMDNGADITIADKADNTSLHVAARTGNPDMLELLLVKLVSNQGIIGKQNKDKETPLHLAVTSKNRDCVAKLLNAGAAFTMHIENEQGQTATDLAKEQGNKRIISLLEDPQKEKELFQAKPKPMPKPELGRFASVEPDSATVPPEIKERGPEAQRAFLKAMWSGEVQVHRGRLMFIGQDGAGKTSLKKSLLGVPFNPQEDSTVGIEVDPSKFEVDVDHAFNWQRTEQKHLAVHEFNEDIAKIIATDLMYHSSLSGQTQPTEQIDPDVRGMDQNSLSKKGNVSMEDIASRVPGSRKLDEKEKRMRHPDLYTGSLEERNEPLDLDIETNVVFSSELMERVVRYLNDLKLDHEVKAKEYMLDMWDFAGQHLYYASHPVFLSPRAVYILVCNLSKELNAVAEPCVKQGVTRKLHNTNEETNLENLLSWLVSVRRLRPETKDDGKLLDVRPKVIIVGTNADSRAVEDRNEMLTCIQESLTENDDLQKHVIRPLFSIDNTGSQADDREALREKILEVLRLEPYMGEKVPVRWFHFEKIVQALVAKKKYHVRRDNLQTIIKKVCHIEDMEELKLMLDFYHDLGQIVQHGSTIVLQTQWLIDLFKQVITVKPFNDMDPCLNSCWLELQDQGILRMELIDHVFDEHIKTGLDKEDILSLMEHYGLIAKFSPTEKPRIYFVPAQLASPPAELCEKKPSDCDPCSLYVNFTEGFVPHGLFPQLLTRCIAWCSKHGFPKEPRLHDCGARFFLGKQPFYSLVLICRKRSIKVVLTEINPASGPSHSSSKDLDPWDVRVFLDDTLAGLSQELPWLCSLVFEWCVACTRCQCTKHKSVCCPHEECLHLHKVDFSQTTIMAICEKSLKDETIKVSGLDKWCQASKERETGKHSKVNPLPLTEQIDLSEDKQSSTRIERSSCSSSGNPERNRDLVGVQQSSARKRKSSSSATQVTKQNKVTTMRDEAVQQSSARKRKSSSSATQVTKQTKVTTEIDEVAFKDGKPKDRELDELAAEIGKLWDKVGLYLDIPQEVLDEIAVNAEDKPYRMLLRWRNKSTSTTLYKDLYDALCHKRVGLNDVAKLFCCKEIR